MKKQFKSSHRLLFAACFLFGVALDTAPAQHRTASKPNIVLILTDDQGWWDLGVHGNRIVETPAIDRLAAEGVRLSHFYASPVCTPTRAALMTGRHYQRTGAYDTYMGRDTMRVDEVTMGEVLQAAGYRTALVGKWHLGRYMKYHPNHQGFDEFFGFWQYGFINDYFDSGELFEGNQAVETTGYVTDVLTERAITFIEQNKDRPFFLDLAYNAPHLPYLVPDRYAEKYLKKGLPLREAQIYGMVNSIDDQIARLLKTIDEKGLRENTVIIFMSDNGGVSRHFKAGLRGIKGSVYEGGVRAPFIARYPDKFPPGAVVDAMAQHIDVLPTLCELTGAALPKAHKLDGHSILPLLKNGSGESPHEYLFHQWNRVRPVLDVPGAGIIATGSVDGRGALPNWAIRDRRGYKLVATAAAGQQPVTQYELFDLRSDPGEAKNIAAEHPEVVRRFRDEFARWFTDVTAGQQFGRVPIEIGRTDESTVELDLLWAEAVGAKVNPTYRQYNRDIVNDWTEVNDSIKWRIDVTRAGRYEVILSYGCHPADAGSRLRVSMGKAKLDHETRATAGREIFRPVTAGTLELTRGATTLEIKPLAITGSELFALHKVWLKRVER